MNSYLRYPPCNMHVTIKCTFWYNFIATVSYNMLYVLKFGISEPHINPILYKTATLVHNDDFISRQVWLQLRIMLKVMEQQHWIRKSKSLTPTLLKKIGL